MQTEDIFKINTRHDFTKIIGCAYFIVLALLNAAFSMVGKDFGWFDFFVIIAVAMPLLVNRNWFYRFFGLANVLAFLVTGVTILMNIHTIGTLDFFVGFGLSVSAIAFGLLLIYAGMYSQEQN